MSRKNPYSMRVGGLFFTIADYLVDYHFILSGKGAPKGKPHAPGRASIACRPLLMRDRKSA
ncbi:MAG: hypothetical protein ABIC40_06330 [bacterium]